MDDNQDLEKEKKQQELDQASQKFAHVAGKGAATYFGKEAGGQIYDLASKTKAGQDIEKLVGKTLQNNLFDRAVVTALDKSGALDAAEKVVDTVGGKGTDALGKVDDLKGISNVIDGNGDGLKDTKGMLDSLSSLGQSDSNAEESESTQNNSFDLFDISSGINQKKIALIALAGAFVVIVLIVVVVVAGLFGPLESASNFVKGLWDGVVDFFTTDQQELEEKYYQELKDVQQEFYKDYNVCIDANLITAALTVNRNFDSMLEDGNVEDESGDGLVVDGEDEDGDGVPDSSNTLSYTKMTKQIKLLARMQIMTKKYGLDDGWKKTNGDYCADTSSTKIVDSTNEANYNGSFFENGKDSSTPELIASHDEEGAFAFFKKKVNQEKNYAYYMYYPKATSQPIKDINQNVIGQKRVCNTELPEDEYEISIGTYQTSTDSVFYWNLVNSFIPDYYDEYLPDSEPERTTEIRRIADEIYLLYDELGPNQTCGVSYAGPSSLCPSGITIDGVGTMHLEEYVAGVVSNEAYNSEGMEALKAQAVAARTYALKITDYCQSSIENSTNAQTFTRDVNDRAREATNSTSGEILIDREGKIFAANYDSFCYDDKDCPDAVKNSDGTYTVTYTKVPYGEKHKITLSDSSQYGRILPGQGHGRGMSQLLSYELAKDGKSYTEILSYFYSDGVEISLVLSPSNTDGATIVRGPISNYLENANSSISDMNQYIYSQVSKAGIGTRDGVVAAATSLVSGFYNKTGLKLPYELYPSGKYSGYGMDPSWGTNTGRGDYPLNGLDCSGFISWAIHNGGFGYELKNAQGWGNAGIKRSWSKGATDSSARAGDLIYNAPASSNGTSGHIRMIIGVTSDGYVVAEASGKKNGVRINNISFTSTGSYYLVDMSSYYANATVVNDYPM